MGRGVETIHFFLVLLLQGLYILQYSSMQLQKEILLRAMMSGSIRLTAATKHQVLLLSKFFFLRVPVHPNRLQTLSVVNSNNVKQLT